MQRSSSSIGALAAALAKAQSEIKNPEKSLTATVMSPFPREGSRTFRYAPLSSGLDLVRKCLGQQEIATVQTTAIDAESGLIHLTTTLVHASGEWVSSDWPVCPVSETAAPHRLGSALTYARRYALFTLVGIAGEDDLDAPDIPRKEPVTVYPTSPRRSGNGTAHAPTELDKEGSAELRDRLLAEIAETSREEALAVWAKRVLPLKKGLTADDATALETAYLAKLTALTEAAPTAPHDPPTSGCDPSALSMAAAEVSPLSKPVRQRSRAHLVFVASEPCVICKTTPCDAHHLKVARPRSLGRKVSDEFTVPLCRKHHRELHRHGDERAWWQNQGIDPLPLAATLWERTEPVAAGPTQALRELTPTLPELTGANGCIAGRRGNDETKPILRAETQ